MRSGISQYFFSLSSLLSLFREYTFRTLPRQRLLRISYATFYKSTLLIIIVFPLCKKERASLNDDKRPLLHIRVPNRLSTCPPTESKLGVGYIS